MKNVITTKILLFFWILSGSLIAQDQLIPLPVSNNHYTEYNQIAYVQSDDDIIPDTYAYLAYTIKDLNANTFVVYIKGLKTAGAKLDPNHSAFISKCKKAAQTSEKYFVHGFSMKARPADSRVVEFRIHVDGKGNPINLELYLVTRNADGTPKDAVSQTVPWPTI